MKKKNLYKMMLVISVVCLGLSGCQKNGSATKDTTAQSTVSEKEKSLVEVEDLAGNVVEVPKPEDLKSIVITSYKGAYGAAVLLGQIDKVTGMADMTEYAWLRYAFPETSKLKNYGSFDEINVEELVQDNPDVIISPSASTKANEKLKELDMPVLIDGIDIKDNSDVFVQTYDEIRLVARLTGTIKKADEYFGWADELFEMVDERVKDIPEEQRIKVLPIRQDITQVFGNNCIWGYVVEMAGGINLSGKATDGTGKFFADVDAEQLAKWNPEMMFQINFKGEFTDEIADRAITWKNDKKFSSLPALNNGNTYLIPGGIANWNGTIEAPLCVVWMAKIMYPDLFKDIDIKELSDEFYKTYVNYDLTDKDWAIIAPQFKGMNANGLSK